MSLSTDKQIRAALKVIIQAQAPKALVLTRWSLSPIEDSQNWPGELITRHPDEQDLTHGYVILRRRLFGKSYQSAGISELWEYNFFGLHYHLPGDDTFNSEEDLFAPEITNIVRALNTATNVELGYASRPEPLEPADFVLDFQPFGDAMFHVAYGTMRLEPCEVTP